MNPIEKYQMRAREVNSLVCVGLDSDVDKIPKHFRNLEFPQFEFNKYIIEETVEFASAYKPNSAFYEARGDIGIRELKMTMDYLAEHYPDVFTILDAKRGDIGNTNNGYIEAIFDWLGFDAITLHPYMGQESLKPFLSRKDKLSIILCRTSNPGAGEFQDLLIDGKPLWSIVAEKVSNEWNTHNNCMLVVGATYPEELQMVRSIVGDMTLLVPGVGAQGGDIKAVVEAGKNKEGAGLIISASRSVIFSDSPKEEARKNRDEINTHRN